MKAPRLAALTFLLSACGGATPTAAPPPTRAEEAQACGSLSRLQLSAEATSLLAGRLGIRMPRGTEGYVGRAMLGPRPPETLETQLELVDGEGRKLRVIAMELFRRPSGPLAPSVEAWLRDGGSSAEVEPLEVPARLVGVFVAGDDDDVHEEGLALVGRAVVHGDDGALMNVSFFVSPGIVRAEGVAPCAALARRIATTLTPGPRRLGVDGGRRALGEWVSIDVPAGYASVVHSGRDFEVHYLYPLAPLDAPHAQLGIYIGPEPSSHVRDVLEMRNVEGSLLGRSVEWQLWTTARRGRRIRHRETMVELEGAGGRFVHVFLVASDEDTERDLSAIAESLALSAR